jgi:hypothetical protein
LGGGTSRGAEATGRAENEEYIGAGIPANEEFMGAGFAAANEEFMGAGCAATGCAANEEFMGAGFAAATGCAANEEFMGAGFAAATGCTANEAFMGARIAAATGCAANEEFMGAGIAAATGCADTATESGAYEVGRCGRTTDIVLGTYVPCTGWVSTNLNIFFKSSAMSHIPSYRFVSIYFTVTHCLQHRPCAHILSATDRSSPWEGRELEPRLESGAGPVSIPVSVYATTVARP